MNSDSTNATSTSPECVVDKKVKFVIPDEGEEALWDETKLDMDAELGLRIRRPGRFEFIKINPAGELSTVMLPYKSSPDDQDEKNYWVAKELRSRIAGDLRHIRYLPCYSCPTQRLFIMPIKVSDTDWYRSQEVLLKRPPGFYETQAVRIYSVKGRYEIVERENSDPVSWPAKSTAELVTEAIGDDCIISSPEHPVYQELITGRMMI